VKVGDLAFYWPKWHPTEKSSPAGIAVLLEFDGDEDAHLEGKPGRPQWHILFEGCKRWVTTWQVQEIS